MIKVIILSLLCFVIYTAPFTLYKHNISTGARCLDGSQAALYVSPGDNSNVIVYFVGGGFCAGKSLSATLQSCYQRSFSDLGSSENYKDTINSKGGILSNSNTSNPHFYNWTKVIIPYCDGSFHQGTRKQGINYKERTLYFRGTNNTLEHFKYLDSSIGLFNAQKIIITGTSAGGVAAFLWSNYLIQNTKSQNVYSVPDSGMFISNFPNPYTGNYDLMEAGANLVSIVNTEIDMPISNCVKEMKTNDACFMINAYPQYLKAPTFIVQSQYDQYCLRNILTIACPSKGALSSYSLQKCTQVQRAFIQQYRSATLKAFDNFTSHLTNIGFWAPACVQHGFIETNVDFTGEPYKVPTTTGILMSDAIYKFINNISDTKGNRHIDQVSWPNNTGCSAKSNLHIQKQQQWMMSYD